MILLAKVKFDLRNPDELYFSQREIDSLLATRTKFIKTIGTLMKERPFNLLDDEVIHLITRLAYMGEGQAFRAEIPCRELLTIVRKATFFRELYAIFEIENNLSVLKREFETIGLDINNDQLKDQKIDANPYTQIFLKELSEKNELVTIRFMPFHTIFEYVTEVKKLPAAVFRPKNSEDWGNYFEEKEAGIRNGIDELLAHLKSGHYRSPHFGLGKDHVGDFVDWASTDLRKPFLHYLHKYKGKGDPRISRALINLLNVHTGDTILDPFAGSGAFIADAPTMGINAIGVEILNIGKMIAEVKCNLGIDLSNLRRDIIKVFDSTDKPLLKQDLRNELSELKNKMTKNGTYAAYGKIEPHLGKILFLRKEIEGLKSEEIRKFLLILLSQQVVEYSEKSRTWDIVNSFKAYVEDRYLTLYATNKLAEILDVNLSKSMVRIIKGDSTNMSMLKDRSIDGILTSPPYFDALDYIGNNKTSILVLGLDEDLVWESTKGFYEAKHRDERNHEKLPLFVSDKYVSIELPESSMRLIELLEKSQRSYKSKIVKNYLKMMKLSFEECYRVLKKDRYYLMVISKFHSWIINNKEEIVDTSPVLGDLGKSVGFKLVDVIEHGLSKADKGKIGVEDILVFQK